MNQTKHIHKFLKVNLTGKDGKYSVMKCIHSGCPFYINSKLSFGYQVECWRCGEVFTMTVKNVNQKKPHCSDCIRSPVQIET